MTLIYCTKCKKPQPFASGLELMAHMDKEHPPLEDVVQRAVISAYQTVGCTVYDLSQGYRPHKCRHCGAGLPRNATSRQTPGLSDLYILPPFAPPVLQGLVDNGYGGSWLLERFVPWWHETKRARGFSKHTDEQKAFQAENRRHGIVVVVGGVNEAIAELRRRGIIK